MDYSAGLRLYVGAHDFAGCWACLLDVALDVVAGLVGEGEL